MDVGSFLIRATGGLSIPWVIFFKIGVRIPEDSFKIWGRNRKNDSELQIFGCEMLDMFENDGFWKREYSYFWWLGGSGVLVGLNSVCGSTIAECTIAEDAIGEDDWDGRGRGRAGRCIGISNLASKSVQVHGLFLF